MPPTEPDHYAGQDRGDLGAYASYFAGMDASMQQKVALTTAHFPARGRVADMGSGSGRGTYDLACLHPDLDLVGVDINPTSVDLAAQTYRRSNLRYVCGDIADPVFPPESLDGILDSSVLHHVTSFTGYNTARLETCLDHQVAALRPGGVLIIRDFVIPDGPDEVFLDLPTTDGAAEGADPATLSTFARWQRYAATVRNSRYQPGDLPWSASGLGEGWQRVACILRDAQEFLLRKDYTRDWDVELLEEYTYWTQTDFVRACTRRGLRVVTAAPIRNPWILSNRYQGQVRLSDRRGAPLPFPPTNLLIVGQKVRSDQGVRLTLHEQVAATAPTFLHLERWRGSDGRTYDLARRPGRTLDLLPWMRRDGQVLVLARRHVVRPLVVVDDEGALNGAAWSGWLTEPVAAIVDEAEDLDNAARRIVHERSGVDAARITGLSTPWRYATSPGGFDELVTARLVALDDIDLATLPDDVAVVDARACLRAAQVGGLFDARLELNCYRLFRDLGEAPGAWIGADLPTAPRAPDTWPRDAEALRPADRIRFTRVEEAPSYLDVWRGRFAEVAADGQVVAEHEREWVAPRETSVQTATVLPLIASAHGWLVGLEHRALPALQIAIGRAAYATVPAWRLPKGLAHGDAAKAWLRARLADLGLRPLDLIDLGGAYLASPGATPELVHPQVAICDPAGGPCGLAWIGLADAVADLHALVDAHLALALLRCAHAAGIALPRINSV